MVTECEILPQLITRRLWAKRLAGSNVLSLVDSEPAKFGLIKGMSDTGPGDVLIRSIALGTLRPLLGFGTQECLPFSNIADDQFRLLFISLRKNFQRPCCATPQITFRHHQSLSDSPSIKLVVGIYINCILTINLYILTSELGELFYLFYIPVFSFRLTFLRSAVRLCVL